jgi:molybdenum cofactor cytidylyltransferase
MRGKNKLLLPFKEGTIIEAVINSILRIPVKEVIVVTGYDDAKIREVIRGYDVNIVYNPDYKLGMSTSIKAGVIGSSGSVDGVMIYLGDMPLVLVDTLRRLCGVFVSSPDGSIVVPVFEGRRGNPVIFSSVYRDELMSLCGDTGARSIIESHPDSVVEVQVSDPGIFQDVDDWIEYESILKR